MKRLTAVLPSGWNSALGFRLGIETRDVACAPLDDDVDLGPISSCHRRDTLGTFNSLISMVRQHTVDLLYWAEQPLSIALLRLHAARCLEPN
jgi:hypothetical protein